MQKTFSFAVRDSLINVGPLKDFSYGLRINADPNATGIAKQSNYELVSFAHYVLLVQNFVLLKFAVKVPSLLVTWCIYHLSSTSLIEASNLGFYLFHLG